MFQITRKSLELAYRFSQLRNPPSPMAGSKSRAHRCTLQYDGGNTLGLWWTDTYRTVFCALPIAPRDRTRFTVSVLASNEPIKARRGAKAKRKAQTMEDQEGAIREPFDGAMVFLLKYLPEFIRSRLAEQQNSGLILGRPAGVNVHLDLRNAFPTLDGQIKVPIHVDWEKPETTVTISVPSPEGRENVTLVDRGPVHGLLYGTSETDFQLAGTLAEDGPRTTIDILALSKSLRFLAQGSANRDLDHRTATCTLFEDGHAMGAASRHRGDAVVLDAQIPTLPFDVTLADRDLRAFAEFVRILSKVVGLKQVEIVDLSSSDVPRYSFRDKAGKYRLWVPAVNRPFLREVIAPTLAVPAQIAVKVSRRDLWREAKLFAPQAVERKLLGKVARREGDAVELHVRPHNSEANPSEASLDAAIHPVAGAVFAERAFAVAAPDLIAALEHFSREKVLLIFRPSRHDQESPDGIDQLWPWLEIQTASAADDTTRTTADRRAFVRIAPAPGPSVPVTDQGDLDAPFQRGAGQNCDE